VEYFAGAFIAISVWIVASRVLQNKISKQKMKRVVYRQSHLFEIIKPAIPFMPVKIEKIDTQASKHQESHMMRFLFLNGKAYWIANNAVFVAEIDDQGIVEESKKVVDTMAMDDVQLKEIEFIVNKLTEGNRK
jgi:hypothetical protein